MRPINLKIKGINSYVNEQEICFDKLSESNLFGVFGETGSGKTTILDAIIIALYGSSDREIIPNIINVNCDTAYIYFKFTIENDADVKTYYVKREFTVRKSGIKSDAILLDENNKVLAEQPEQVNEAILKLVGIAKKEFQRCIALPQGEFDRFLTDTPANRKKTIAKLFNLEMFGVELQEKIKKYRDFANINKMNIEEKLTEYKNINDESLQGLRNNLNENQKLLNLTVDALKEARENFDIYKKDYEINSKLIDLNSKMALIKSEEDEIKQLKEQIDYTKNYGELIELNNKKAVLESEITTLTDDLLVDKKLIVDNEDKLKETESQISIKMENLRSAKARLQLLAIDLEKYQKLTTNKQILEDNREIMEAEISSVSRIVEELNESLLSYKKLSDEQQLSCDKIERAISSNDDILNRLKEVKTVKTVENFVDYLNYLKNTINPDSLQEVYQFKIHQEVQDLIQSITEYETESRKKVVHLEKEYDALLVYNENLDQLEETLERSNRGYLKVLETTKANVDEARTSISVCMAKIDEKTQRISDLKHQLRELNTRIKINESEIGSLKDTSGYQKLSDSCDAMAEEIAEFNAFRDELLTTRNELIVAIEVGTVQLENMHENLSQINKRLKQLGSVADKYNSELDKTHCISEEALAEAEVRVARYDRESSVLQAQIDDLLKDRVHENVDLNVVQSEMENIKTLENKEKNYSINIALCNQFISQMKDEIVKVKQIEKQREDWIKKIATINELSNLTSGGKLLDYVSEEYMQLITQFSNKFVYGISKGKYLLKYTGEFFVIDNFNGGVCRSVKTLSGGERFIISLSLALGISQSIAINNNKKVNFFFIDEGFGSLSDEYIETVLNSFDALIKLNFTVGFISHVEKMQNYINNRIVVTKKNNDEGSIIKQYY